MKKIRWIFLVLLLLSLACNLPGNGPEPMPTPTLPPPTDAPPPTTAPTPTLEPTATTDPYADIPDADPPGSPVLTYWGTECNTGRYSPAIDEPVVGKGCDSWETNFIERPINQTLDMYYPYLDIVQFQMGRDADWIYADIQTFSLEDQETALTGSYALEMDFDFDADGDLLVLVTNPAQYGDTEWHRLGVQVWQDVNDDVGGETPYLAEETNPGDGYETQLFDQGLGDDPGLAWAKLSSKDDAVVEFAFNRSLVQSGGAYAWWVWASQEPLVPANFDYVDTFGKEEVYQIGNSCRWIFDGAPQPIFNVCPYLEPTSEPGDRDEQKYCLISYTFGAAVVSECVPCPANCSDINDLPGMGCEPGCTP